MPQNKLYDAHESCALNFFPDNFGGQAMLKVGEVNLIGEFVEQALQAGLVRSADAAGRVVLIFEVLQREAREAQQIAQVEAAAARDKEIAAAVAKAIDTPDVKSSERGDRA